VEISRSSDRNEMHRFFETQCYFPTPNGIGLYGNIPTKTPIAWASSAGGVGKIAILDEYIWLWQRSLLDRRVSSTLRSSYCIVEANYWQTRSVARSLCDNWACLETGPEKVTDKNACTLLLKTQSPW